MPDIDFNDESVKAAIAEQAAIQAKVLAEKQIADGGYIPASEIEGLKNKNQELLDWKVNNKDKIVSETEAGELTEMRRIRAAKDNDEFVKLVMDGKTEEAKALASSGVSAAWKEKNDEVSTQFKLAQEKILEQTKLIEVGENKITDMSKRTFLRELTSSDDSFKKDHFEDFFALNSSKMQMDQDTGAVYAIDSSGKTLMDTEGNKVTFADHYSKQKINGLFWQAGKGSNARGIEGDGSAAGADPRQWTHEEQSKFIAEHGRQAYSTQLAKAIKAKAMK